jgi:hypothetical protein
MKKDLAVVLLVAAVAAGNAQEPREQRGRRVVDECVKALGGEAFLTLQDRTETGRIYSFDMGTGKLGGGIFATLYTQYLQPSPGKLAIRIRQVFGQRQDEGGTLILPDKAWDISFHGARPMDDESFSTYKDTTMRGIFYILRERMKDPGISFYWQSSDIFEHVPVDIVDVLLDSNVLATVYFDRGTHLPLRQTFRRKNKEFDDFDIELSAYAKYREFNGITLPLETRRERNGRKIYEMFVETETLNKGLSDNTFTLPANLKVLK